MVNYLDYLDEKFNIRIDVINERYENVILFYWNDIDTIIDKFIKYFLEDDLSIVTFSLEMDKFSMHDNQKSFKEFMMENVFIPYIFESDSSIFYNDYWSEFCIFATKLDVSESERNFCIKKYKDNTESLRDKGYYFWDEMAHKYNFYKKEGVIKCPR